MTFNNCYHKIQELLIFLEKNGLTQANLEERGITFFADEISISSTQDLIMRKNTRIDNNFILPKSIITIFDYSNMEETIEFDGNNFFIVADGLYYHPNYLDFKDILDWIDR